MQAAAGLVGAGDPEHGAAAEHAAVQRLPVRRHGRRGARRLGLPRRAGGGAISADDVVREAHPLLAHAPRLVPLLPLLCDARGTNGSAVSSQEPARWVGRSRRVENRGGAGLTGRGEARPEARRRSAGGVGVGGGRDQLRLLGAAEGEEDERAGERHGGGSDGEARVGARRGRGRRRRHPPRREIQLAAASAPTGEEGEQHSTGGEGEEREVVGGVGPGGWTVCLFCSALIINSGCVGFGV